MNDNEKHVPHHYCEQCKGEFPKKRYWHRFCSSKCRELWHKELRRDVMVRVLEERNKE